MWSKWSQGWLSRELDPDSGDGELEGKHGAEQVIGTTSFSRSCPELTWFVLNSIQICEEPTSCRISTFHSGNWHCATRGASKGPRNRTEAGLCLILGLLPARILTFKGEMALLKWKQTEAWIAGKEISMNFAGNSWGDQESKTCTHYWDKEENKLTLTLQSSQVSFSLTLQWRRTSPQSGVWCLALGKWRWRGSSFIFKLGDSKWKIKPL